jgi:general secretion pathway protein D
MVFLRPVVVRDGASSETMSLSRYEQMRTVQQDVQTNLNNTGRGDYGTPVLPEQPALKRVAPAPTSK